MSAADVAAVVARRALRPCAVSIKLLWSSPLSGASHAASCAACHSKKPLNVLAYWGGLRLNQRMGLRAVSGSEILHGFVKLFNLHFVFLPWIAVAQNGLGGRNQTTLNLSVSKSKWREEWWDSRTEQSYLYVDTNT